MVSHATSTSVSNVNEQPSATSASSEGRRLCGHKFQVGDVMWKCRTCKLEVGMLNDRVGIMCEKCFKGRSHEGHEIFECHVDNNEDLICDCGDISCWNISGCCARHRTAEEDESLVLFLQQNHPMNLQMYARSELKELDLSNSRIDADGMKALQNSLSTNGCLSKLHLGKNRIGADGAKVLGSILLANTTITYLDVKHNDIGDEGVDALADVLNKNNTLAYLTLDHNGIDVGGASTLGKMLVKNTGLTHLQLNNNSIANDGAKALGNALCSNTNIICLGLTNNFIDKEGGEAIGKALNTNSTLLYLYLDFNFIGDEGATVFGKALQINNTLIHLSLKFNSIRDEGAKAFGDALSVNNSMKNLNLNNNGIALDGIKALRKALCQNTTLTSLHLLFNEIYAEGAKELGKVLLANKTLIKLDLSNNFIFPEGAKELGKVISKNDTLADLNLFNNCIGDEGAKAIGKALATNSSLTNLNLDNNGIGAEGAKALIESLKKNNGISSIHFDQSDTYDEMRYVILPLLKENKIMKKHDMLSDNSILFYVDIKNTFVSTSKQNRIELDWRYLKNNGITKNGGDHPITEGEQIWEAAQGSGKALKVFHHLLQEFLGEEEKHKQYVPLEHKNKLDVASVTPTKMKECIIDLINEKTNQKGSTLLHVAAALESTESFELCQYLVQVGADFDKVLDPLGRSARDIAVANSNPQMVEWARAFGTFLGRYKFDEGPPVHRSATCTVKFATDVKVPKNHEHRVVAIKIMEKKEQFQRELERRLYNPEPYYIGLEKDVNITDNIFDEDHVVPILRYHTHILDGEREVRCLIMPKGERNFSQIIDSERIAGEDLNKIYFFVRDISYAVQHIHNKGRMIHGDLKPRNIIRLHGGYKLIDFDASVLMGHDPSEKKSTGYVPPEYARRLFFKNDDVEKLKEELETQAVIIKNINPLDDSYGQESKRLEQLKQHFKQLSKERTCQIFTNAVFDVWGLGMLLYTLFTGEYIFLLDRDDNIIKEEDKIRLMNWDGLTGSELEKILPHADPGAQKEAKGLLSVCLEKDVSKRFQSLDDMLRHSFFTGKIDEGYRQIMSELKENREVITNAIFEASEVNTPTRFIILPYRLEWNEEGKLFLPSNTKTDDFKRTLINFQTASTILHLLNEKYRRSKDNYTELMRELGELHKTNKIEALEKLLDFIGISSSASEATIDELDKIEGFWDDPLKALENGVKTTGKKWMSKYRSQKSYLYLLDEYYLAPVVSDGGIYPIEIEQASKHLQNLVPFMRLGIFSVSMLCAVASIFSVPICLPEYMAQRALDMLDMIEKDSSVVDFEVVHTDLNKARGEDDISNLSDTIRQSRSVRGTELRQLGSFFDVHDKNRDYAGLRRCYDKTGTAYWTTVSPEEINGFVVNERRSITWFEALMKKELQKRDVQIQEKDAQVREQNAQIQHLSHNKSDCKSCCIS